MRSELVTPRINQIIRERIKDGVYAPGSRLPSELTLANEFKVSRSTLRNAVNALVSEGIILRKHGNGSFINQHVIQFNFQLQNLWSFPQLIIESGMTPTVKYIDGFTRQSTLAEENNLELGSPQMLYILQRLFLADNQPAIFSTNVFPASLFSDPIQTLDVQLSLYEMLFQYCDLEPIYSVSELHSETPNRQVQDLLKMEPCSSVLYFKDVFYTKDSRPVVLGQNYYNDHVLTMRLVRRKA